MASMATLPHIHMLRALSARLHAHALPPSACPLMHARAVQWSSSIGGSARPLEALQPQPVATGVDADFDDLTMPLDPPHAPSPSALSPSKGRMQVQQSLAGIRGIQQALTSLDAAAR
jgi:hypothetical protein